MAQQRGTTCARCGGERDGKARYCSACNRDYKWCWLRWGRDHKGHAVPVMDPLRLCSTADCPLVHYENCQRCYGFGLRPSKRAGAEAVPVRASDLPWAQSGFEALPCPGCGARADRLKEKQR